MSVQFVTVCRRVSLRHTPLRTYNLSSYCIPPIHSKVLKVKPKRGGRVLRPGCTAADDPCTRIHRKDMPWYAISEGRMPWFECKKSSAANLLEMRVDVKPFCASPELFPGQGNHQQQCWPVEAGSRNGTSLVPPSLPSFSSCCCCCYC